MSGVRRNAFVSPCSVVLAVLLLAIPGLTYAEGATGDPPENATAKRYGRGWACDPGYQQVEGRCVALKLPDNAYPTSTSYGRGWECGWGYQNIDETCIAVAVPPNAYLNSFTGDRWRCDRGYREVNAVCVAIEVPTNG
jgi:hypothetical protein